MFCKMFFSVLEFWVILPSKNFGKVNFNSAIIFFKNVTLLLAVIISTIMLIIFNKKNVYPKERTLFISLEILRILCGISTPLAFLIHFYPTRNKWKMLIKIMDNVKQNIKLSQMEKLNHLFLFLISHFLIILIFLSNIKYRPRNRSVFNDISILSFLFEFLCAFAFQFLHFAIIGKLQEMDKILDQLYQYQLLSLTLIKKLKRIYLNVLEMGNVINKYFGFKLFLIHGNTLARTLWLSMLFIKAQNNHNNDDDGTNIEKTEAEWTQFVRFTILIFVALMPSYLIAHVSNKISKHLSMQINRCYLLESKFKFKSFEYEEIQSLWTFMMEHKLEYSAIDFFIIHPSLLLTMLAATSTYFVALVQFQ